MNEVEAFMNHLPRNVAGTYEEDLDADLETQKYLLNKRSNPNVLNKNEIKKKITS